MVQQFLRSRPDNNPSTKARARRPGSIRANRYPQGQIEPAVVERDEQTHPGHQLAGYELTALALRTPALRDLARRQYQAYRATAAAITAPWMAGRRVDLPGGPDALNHLLAVLFDGLALAWLADPDGTDPDEMFTLIDALADCHTTRLDARDAQSPVPSDLSAADPGNTAATG